ncbi:MAG: hypothetical protein DHS20C16_08370 [Phycisphaerae bacterium]|nr:MAG: hypothetical protein DHS20C16_08370 [Phycisphaerae bacterium]
MKSRGGWWKQQSVALILCVGWVASSSMGAPLILEEDFETVTETGSFTFSGFGFISNVAWDDGVAGENLFAGTEGNARFGAVTGEGDATGGVAGSGGGRLEVANVGFSAIFEDFLNITGTGGGVFVSSNGTSGFTTNWDNGINNEGAFFGTTADAVLGADGGAAASGTPTGGNPAEAGELDVEGVILNSGDWFAGMTIDSGALEGANPFVNGGFDDNGGSFDGWTVFGANNFIDPLPLPVNGTSIFKTFGAFGASNSSGVFQDLIAQPGQTWELRVFSRNDTIINAGLDGITGGNLNEFVMKIEFYDGVDFGTPLAIDEFVMVDNTTTPNVWIENTLQLEAPVGATVARAVLSFEQPANQGGAGFADAVSFEVVSGPPQSLVDLTQISLTADIRGAADLGDGEVLGDVQLRLEDPNQNRLIASGPAASIFQSFGGQLNTFTEADTNGVPTIGIFDLNASTYKVVIAFDNEGATPWGTGGTLTVDNVVLTNSDSTGSTWFAGLFWDDLAPVLDAGCDASQYFVSADVMGETNGGDYVVRVEGNRITQAGLDEDFSDATGVGGGIFLNTNSVEFNFVPGWDTGLTDEAAFGGYTNSTFCEDFPPFFFCGTTGFMARAFTEGGNPDGFGQIKVENLVIGAGGGWSGGLVWANQGLASTDLSQVTLEATVRGIAAPAENTGPIELRIEDSQLDRLFTTISPTGGWDVIGGTLDTFTEAGAAGGGGDGTFNLDSPTYTVVVAFPQAPESTWGTGGRIDVDNLFLTPVDVVTPIGEVAFSDTADGATFQTTGGYLSEGVSTFVDGDFDEDFEAALANTTGFVFASSTNPTAGDIDNFDDGLDGEQGFFGEFGGAFLNANGTVTASVCTDCGFGGTKAAVLDVFDVNISSGTWFAGLTWPNQILRLEGNLDDIRLSARVRAIADDPGELSGTMTVRLEDPDIDFLAVDVPADGTWQDIDVALSDPSVIAAGVGNDDGAINQNADSYALTVVFLGGASGTLGTGVTVQVDDLHLTKIGSRFQDADTYTVTTTFANELDTWGLDGALNVDNVVFSTTGNSDGDSDTDLSDYAAFQRCFSDGAVTAGCECADLTGDGMVTLDDYETFELFLDGPAQ